MESKFFSILFLLVGIRAVDPDAAASTWPPYPSPLSQPDWLGSLRFKRQSESSLPRSSCQIIKANTISLRSLQAACAMHHGLDPELWNSGVFIDLSVYETDYLGLPKTLSFRDTSTSRTYRTSLDQAIRQILNMCCPSTIVQVAKSTKSTASCTVEKCRDLYELDVVCPRCPDCEDCEDCAKEIRGRESIWLELKTKLEITVRGLQRELEECNNNSQKEMIGREKQQQQQQLQQVSTMRVELSSLVEGRLATIADRLDRLSSSYSSDGSTAKAVISLEKKLDLWMKEKEKVNKVCPQTPAGMTKDQEELMRSTKRALESFNTSLSSERSIETLMKKILDDWTIQHRQTGEDTDSKKEVKDKSVVVVDSAAKTCLSLTECRSLKCTEIDKTTFLQSRPAEIDKKIHSEEEEDDSEEESRNTTSSLSSSLSPSSSSLVLDRLRKLLANRDRDRDGVTLEAVYAVVVPLLEARGFQGPETAISSEVSLSLSMLLLLILYAYSLRFRMEIGTLYRRHFADLKTMQGRSLEEQKEILMAWFDLLHKLMRAGMFHCNGSMMSDEKKREQEELLIRAQEERDAAAAAAKPIIRPKPPQPAKRETAKEAKKASVKDPEKTEMKFFGFTRKSTGDKNVKDSDKDKDKDKKKDDEEVQQPSDSPPRTAWDPLSQSKEEWSRAHSTPVRDDDRGGRRGVGSAGAGDSGVGVTPKSALDKSLDEDSFQDPLDDSLWTTATDHSDMGAAGGVWRSEDDDGGGGGGGGGGDGKGAKKKKKNKKSSKK